MPPAVLLTPMPDVESALMFALVPMEPSIRFVTVMPAGELSQITARIKRLSGGNGTSIWIDRPVVDIDVWGTAANTMNVSIAARNIQADIMSLMGIRVTNGVIQNVQTVSSPRQIPEADVGLVRYSASYEIRIHP
jgi:hypothetical protein